MRTPEYATVAPDLWQWNDWFIAFAAGKFWLLTGAAREFGPFDRFEQAYCQTRYLC